MVAEEKKAVVEERNVELEEARNAPHDQPKKNTDDSMLSVEYISSMFAMFTTSHTHELLLRELNATCSVCVRLVEQMKKKTLRVQWQ